MSTLYHLTTSVQCLTFIKLYQRKHNFLKNTLKNDVISDLGTECILESTLEFNSMTWQQV